MQSRKVDLFRDGPGQAVRIPKEFELPGTEATIRREGAKLVVEAVRRDGLVELLDRLGPIDEPFPAIDDPFPEPVEL